MLKKKLKTLACIFALIVLISSLSFATTENAIEPRTTDNSENEGVSLISENPEGEAVTTSDDQNTTGGETDTSDGEGTDTSDESYYQDLVSDDLYKVADTIEVDNLIDGNAYLFGKDVTISGQIGGDMFVVAQNVNLVQESYVYGNLFVIADTITIDGIICDLYSVSQKLDITANGIILRDMRSSAENINLNGNVGRNTHLTVANLTVGETAIIYGNLNYASSKAITVPEGTVNGTINFKEDVSNNSNTIIVYVMSAVYTLVFTLVIFGLMLLLAPKFTAKVEQNISKKFLLSLGVGILSFIVIPAIIIGLMLSIVGTSISLILLSTYLLILAISSAIVNIALGSVVGNKVGFLGKAHNLLGIILVTLILWGLTLIPYAGSFIRLIIMIFGLGIFILSICRKKEKAENVVNENE